MTMPDAAEIARGLSESERRRLIYGRRDWREADWQDHCGEVDCSMCDGALIPDPEPQRLSSEDAAVRAELLKDADDA